MAYTVRSVNKASLAAELGLQKGDQILKINAEPLHDLIDYQFLCAGKELSVEFKRNGELHEVSCEKEEWEELGAEFEEGMLSTRLCANNCVFCFVDQMPTGCRESLYVKDDDWRMSLMMGNFVTLTNVGENELARIIARRASPLYISVHATNPELRVQMLRNPTAGKLMQQLLALQKAGLQFHTQAVICPGLNDRAELDRSIQELAALHPAALSMAVVPVGLTGHRNGLPDLRLFTKEEAAQVVAQVEAWQARFLKEKGTRFVFAADEWYAMAGLDFPPPSTYEGYPQIENGVGLHGQLVEDFEYGYQELSPPKNPRKLLIACGTSIAPYLRALLKRHPIKNVRVTVQAVENIFFGPTVTVTGLLTYTCLAAALKPTNYDELLLTSSMFKSGTTQFLDDRTAGELATALNIPVRIVPDGGEGLAEGLTGKGGTLIHG